MADVPICFGLSSSGSESYIKPLILHFYLVIYCSMIFFTQPKMTAGNLNDTIGTIK